MEAKIKNIFDRARNTNFKIKREKWMKLLEFNFVDCYCYLGWDSKRTAQMAHSIASRAKFKQSKPFLAKFGSGSDAILVFLVILVLDNQKAQCHSYLSGNKNCHEFRFSIVRIVISVSNITNIKDCLFHCLYCCHFLFVG